MPDSLLMRREVGQGLVERAANFNVALRILLERREPSRVMLRTDSVIFGKRVTVP